MVATILMIFLRVLPIFFLWPTTRGPQELGGPGSLNRLNPRFLRHCTYEGLMVSSVCMHVLMHEEWKGTEAGNTGSDTYDDKRAHELAYIWPVTNIWLVDWYLGTVLKLSLNAPDWRDTAVFFLGCLLKTLPPGAILKLKIHKNACEAGAYSATQTH